MSSFLIRFGCAKQHTIWLAFVTATILQAAATA
jgi:hypothetical protein